MMAQPISQESLIVCLPCAHIEPVSVGTDEARFSGFSQPPIYAHPSSAAMRLTSLAGQQRPDIPASSTPCEQAQSHTLCLPAPEEDACEACLALPLTAGIGIHQLQGLG